MGDIHTENKTSETCNYPKGRVMKIGMSMVEEGFVQPGDRLGCYSSERNTSVTLEPRNVVHLAFLSELPVFPESCSCRAI